MTQKILVAHDGSESADKAFHFALDCAAHYGAPLLVLSVARPSEPPEEVETEAMLENAEAYYKEHFETMRREAEARGVRSDFRIAVGHPAEQIIYLADKEGVDHIVLGHRGKSFFERWRVGSISKQVIPYAHCTVTVVR